MKTLHAGKSFGERLRKLRKERIWTLAQLAERLDCDVSYVSRLETGNSRNPSADFVRRAAAVLGVNEQWLELGIGDPKASPIGRELEENTQFLTAFSIFAEQLTLQQILRCVDRVTQTSALSEDSKRFWLHMFAPWIAVKIRLENPRAGVERKATTGQSPPADAPKSPAIGAECNKGKQRRKPKK